jgi:SNF2 family DNA or RNA helicase
MPAAPLRDYQKKGVGWIHDRLTKQHRAVLLADDAGLGKTIQALMAAERLGAERILIICPAGARRVWQAEIQRWVPGWSPLVVLHEPGTSPGPDKPRWVSSLAPIILIVSYDALSNLKSVFARWLRLIQWDLLICDEAHYLKTPTSNRTKAIYGTRGRFGDEGLQAQAERVILLTGTPTPNHAGEIWSHASTFWPWSLTGSSTGRPLTQAEFEDRFCVYKNTVFGRQITGSKRQAVLRERLRDVVLRRRKAQVLPELPPLVLQDIPLDTPVPQFFADFDNEDQLFDRVMRGVPDAVLATMRRELGEMKVLPTIAWVRERLASTNKLLLFAWHREVIARLRRGLAEFNPVVVTGDTPGRERAQAVDAFQQDLKTRLFIGQIQAAGTAITLTAASEVAIVEPSWVPGENVQAICRAHRLGQRDMVLASFLYMPDSLDERIMKVFRRKAAEIATLQGDFHASDPHLRHGSTDRGAHLPAAGNRAAGPAGPGFSDADAAGG